MSDAPTTIVSNSPNFGSKSPEELDAILNAILPDGSLPAEVINPEPAAPEPEKTEAAPEEPEAEPEPEPEPEPEVDLLALEKERDRYERDELRAKLAEQQAHSSRLAGEIGFLKEKIQRGLTSTEPMPDSEEDLDRLSRLERALEQSEERRNRSEVSQAVDGVVARLDGPWVEDLKDEIAAIIPAYAERLQAAHGASTPELGAELATNILSAMQAEAGRMNVQKRYEAAVAKRQAATADMAKAKKAAAPSASGTVPTPAPKPKTISDMSGAEADAWLREHFR